MRSLLAAAALTALGGCAVRDAPHVERALVVAVPASLRAQFDEIARAYEARHPGPGVVLSTAAPDELVRDGSPLDVIAADSPEALAALGPRVVERREYASNPLVLVERVGTPKLQARALAVTPWVQKIAIPDGRSDAAGAAAEAALGRLGLRRELDPRLVYVSSAERAIERVVDGRCELAFARSADLTGRDGVQVADRLDGDETRYPIALVSGTPRLAAARDFVDEVLHGEGRRVLAARGLAPSAAP